MTLPNGFESWMETHHEIVSYLTIHIVKQSPLAKAIQDPSGYLQFRGTAGLYDLAQTLTQTFEEQTQDRFWDGDYYDAIDEYLDKWSKTIINQ